MILISSPLPVFLPSLLSAVYAAVSDQVNYYLINNINCIICSSGGWKLIQMISSPSVWLGLIKNIYLLSCLCVCRCLCVCVFIGMGVSWYVCKGQRTIFKSLVSFSNGFQGLNLGFQDCTAKAFIDAIFLVLAIHCNWDEEIPPHPASLTRSLVRKMTTLL